VRAFERACPNLAERPEQREGQEGAKGRRRKSFGTSLPNSKHQKLRKHCLAFWIPAWKLPGIALTGFQIRSTMTPLFSPVVDISYHHLLVFKLRLHSKVVNGIDFRMALGKVWIHPSW